MMIHRLLPRDAFAYRELMLAAYAAHPDAFTSSVAERAALPLSWWEARLLEDPAAKEVVLGACEDSEGSELLGVVGLSFDQREKARHKATLFGMYVAPDRRGRGLGQTLVDAALELARARPEIRIVQLTVSEGNRAAETLYRQCGFVRFGVEPLAVAVGTGAGARYVAKIHMWCDLRAQPAPITPL